VQLPASAPTTEQGFRSTGYDAGMTTTLAFGELPLSPGQARQQQLELEIPPYRQGGVQYAVAGGGAVPARVDVTAMGGSGYDFRLRFAAELVGPCARCLEPASLKVDADEHLVHDSEAEEEELHSEHVDGERLELDVSSWALELVGLQFPPRVVCREDCAGLCPQCGVDLNEHPGHAHEAPTDSRWDKLRELQLGDDAGE
jgi:uncharacterized protein